MEVYSRRCNLANSILQLNWSDYWSEIDKGTDLSNKLIYIQDKGFYIQGASKYNRITLSQYFVVYGEASALTQTTNGSVGLYIVLGSYGTSATLYYHDGMYSWQAVVGSGTPGTIGVTSIDGKTGIITLGSTLQTNGNMLQTATYEHRQDAAAKVWNIAHNLNKYPSVSIVDSGNNVIYGDITYIDKNNLQIKFSAEFGGRAYLN